MHSTERVVGQVLQKTQIEIIPHPFQWRKAQMFCYPHQKLPPSPQIPPILAIIEPYSVSGRERNVHYL